MARSSACTICPNGCETTVGYEGSTAYAVRGITCPKGDVYVRQELTDPQRNIATSVLVEGDELPLASVRFSRPIPKKEIFRVMGVINTVWFQAPTIIGQVVLHNIRGQDTNVIVTRNVAHVNARVPLLQFLSTPIRIIILRRKHIMKVGLIGLGITGKSMTEDLFKTGHDLTVGDLNQASVDEIVTARTKAAISAEVDEACDVVLTIVPNSPQVKTVMLGEDGVAVHAKSGNVSIDMSSIDSMASKEIAAELARRDIGIPDAPVFGGKPEAVDGTLPFIVGDKKEISDQYKDISGIMSVSVVCCGDVSADNTTRLANQIIVACNVQTLSEAPTLAKVTDVDPELAFQVICSGLTGSTVMNARAPIMVEGNDKPGFKVNLHIKDLDNALDRVHTVGSPLPMTAAVQETFQWLHNNDCGQDDHNSIIKYYKKLAGIESL